MMSLSQEWAALSRAMYGEEFIDELAALLKENNVKTILECGCGDGYILNGLARRGFKGLGIDSSLVMVDRAKINNRENIEFRQLDWLELNQIKRNYDTVICRGNSLSSVRSWDKWYLNQKKSRKAIIKSLDLMFNKLNENGILYLDTVSKSEINKGNHDVKINLPEIKLNAAIKYDWYNKIRKIYGEGYVYGEIFKGKSISYLLTPDELEGMVRAFDPSKVWTPRLEHEMNYDVICARK